MYLNKNGNGQSASIPMNLQFFAEGGGELEDTPPANGGGNPQDNPNANDNNGGGNPQDNKPTYEELLEQLARAQANEATANAEKERFKNSINDLTKKNKNLTEQVRTRMSADEQAEAAKAEAEAARAEADAEKDAKISEFEAKFRKMDYSKRYMGIGMDEKTAEGMADLTGQLEEPEKFFSELGKYIKGAIEKSGENAVQVFLKDRPDIKAGSGGAGKTPLAVEKAKELSKGRKGGISTEALKNFM